MNIKYQERQRKQTIPFIAECLPQLTEGRVTFELNRNGKPVLRDTETGRYTSLRKIYKN